MKVYVWAAVGMLALVRAGWSAGMEVRVRDEAGNAIEGAAVQVLDSDMTIGRGVTGIEGDARLEGDWRGVRQLSVSVSKAGWVSETWVWGAKDEQDSRPEKAEAVLKRATGSIGGAVVDDAGKPLPGARVAVDVETTWKGGWKAVSAPPNVVADGAGRWKIDGLPPADFTLRVGAIHEKGMNASGAIVTAEVKGEALAALLAGQGRVVVKRGESALRLRVVDEQDKPVAGAKVWFGRATGIHPAGTFATDAGGELEVRMPERTEAIGGVLVPGHAMTAWKGKAGGPTVELPVTVGEAGRLTVVDAQGQGVAGVRVIFPRTMADDLAAPWEGTTDAKGELVWPEAPRSTAIAMVVAEGYGLHVGTLMAGKAARVTLQRPVVVEGKVVNAVTGKPVSVKGMKLAVGIASPRQPTSWGPNSAPWEAAAAEGTFYFRTRNGSDEQALVYRVSPTGYGTGESGTIVVKGASVAAEFRVAPAKPVSGVLVDGEGKVLSGREVIVVGAGQHMDIRNGELTGVSREALRLKTDADGRFSFPPQAPGYLVVSLGKDGYVLAGADVVEGQGGKLFLQSWGEVMGTVTSQGGQPGKVAVEQHFGDSSTALVMLLSAADGDTEGEYHLRGIVPGKVMIGRRNDEVTGGQVWSHVDGEIREVEVPPGAVGRMDVSW
jgi:hypothetical protein